MSTPIMKTGVNSRVYQVNNIRLGDKVIFTGRKVGSCVHDSHFQVGAAYRVYYIYPSNGDLEVVREDLPQITIRLGLTEYRET